MNQPTKKDDQWTELQNLLRDVIVTYKEALELLDDGDFGRLGQLLDRRQELYGKAEALIQREGLEPPKKLAEKVTELEDEFQTRLDTELNQVRDELVGTQRRTKSSEKYTELS